MTVVPRGRPRLGVVIPTRNRPHLLSALLTSLHEQTLPVSSLVVVDSSDPAEQSAARSVVEQEWPGACFVQSTRASLPVQKNLGIRTLQALQPVDYVAFMDDDVRPDAEYFARLVGLMEEETGRDIVGASGTTGDRSPSPGRLFRAYAVIFRLWSGRPGALLRSGVNMAVSAEATAPQRSDWLFGCSVWRARVVAAQTFHEGLPGGALFEDVQFSGRAARLGRMVVDPHARLHHLYAPDGRPDTELHEYRWMRNRFEVVRGVHSSRAAHLVFWWSSAGQLALLAMKTLRHPQRHATALRGSWRGFLACIRLLPPL